MLRHFLAGSTFLEAIPLRGGEGAERSYIPHSCGVGVEYGIGNSGRRIDLLLSGRDETGRGNVMIVELKQWESARRTDMDGVVRTHFAEGEANTTYPSYQSWSYAELLRGFNETVNQDQVPLQPCAYLHSCCGPQGGTARYMLLPIR